jgi:hypothetical protein
MDLNEFPLDPHHVRVPLVVPKMIFEPMVDTNRAPIMISKPMVCSVQTVHLSCVEINTISKPVENELPLDLCHLEVPSGVPTKISMPVVHSMQNVHLSCAYIKTISKRNEMSFHLTHVSYEYHRACPKWFPCPWYIQRKLCTYLALRLTLSPNRSKRACTWPTSPRSTIGCAQNDFHAHGAFGANHAPILRQD